MFYNLGYNSLLFYLVAQIVSALPTERYFHYLLCSFEKPPSLRGSVSTALLSSSSSCVSPLQPYNQPFSKEPWFLTLETGIRTQGLGARYACCYWGGVDSRPSQLTEQRNVCDHTNLGLYTYL